eukprot:365679-Chlamydomonas_euryale.AAC.29
MAGASPLLAWLLVLLLKLSVLRLCLLPRPSCFPWTAECHADKNRGRCCQRVAALDVAPTEPDPGAQGGRASTCAAAAHADTTGESTALPVLNFRTNSSSAGAPLLPPLDVLLACLRDMTETSHAAASDVSWVVGCPGIGISGDSSGLAENRARGALDGDIGTCKNPGPPRTCADSTACMYEKLSKQQHNQFSEQIGMTNSANIHELSRKQTCKAAPDYGKRMHGPAACKVLCQPEITLIRCIAARPGLRALQG